MDLISDSFKENVKLVSSLCVNLANKANDCKTRDATNEMPIVLAVKYTLCRMTNMLQSQGLNLEIGVKTKRSKPKRQDIVTLESIYMLAESIETLMMRNMVLVTTLDLDRVDYMRKLSLLIELLKEIEVKYGDIHE